MILARIYMLRIDVCDAIDNDKITEIHELLKFIQTLSKNVREALIETELSQHTHTHSQKSRSRRLVF